jgi:hypothetical protein
VHDGVGGQLGGQQQRFVEHLAQVDLGHDGPDGRAGRTRGAMVGGKSEAPHHLGCHITQSPWNGGNNPTRALAQISLGYDH